MQPACGRDKPARKLRAATVSSGSGLLLALWTEAQKVNAVAQDVEASRGGLIKGEAIEAGVLKVDNALAADADEVVMVVEIGVEAGLLVTDVDTRDEMMVLEQGQSAVDGAAR